MTDFNNGTSNLIELKREFTEDEVVEVLALAIEEKLGLCDVSVISDDEETAVLEGKFGKSDCTTRLQISRDRVIVFTEEKYNASAPIVTAGICSRINYHIKGVVK